MKPNFLPIYVKLLVSGKPTEMDDVGCDGMYIESVEVCTKEVANLEARIEAVEEDRDTIAEWLSKALDRNADKLEADSKHLDAILQFFRDDGFDEDIVYSISKYCEKHGLPIND